MTKEQLMAMTLLKLHIYRLNKQQIKTFKGQILSGDINGFKKGLNKVMDRSKKNERTAM